MKTAFAALLCLVCTFAAAQNTAPKVFVDASSDYFGNGAFLFCSTADDGQVRPLQFLWSKVSGPGAVYFDAQLSRTTHARFSAKGLYVVQCAVSDGQNSVTDTVTILAQTYADIAVRP